MYLRWPTPKCSDHGLGFWFSLLFICILLRNTGSPSIGHGISLNMVSVIRKIMCTVGNDFFITASSFSYSADLSGKEYR